ARPRHPYTQALLSAIPTPDPTRRTKRIILAGDVPTAMAPPQGCRFHTRCLHAQARCRREMPLLQPAGPGHQVACHIHAIVPALDVVARSAASAASAFDHRLAAFEAAKLQRTVPAAAPDLAGAHTTPGPSARPARRHMT